MPIDFPDNPTVNQEFLVGGRSWTWTGTTWDAVLETADIPLFATVPLSFNSETRTISIDLSNYATTLDIADFISETAIDLKIADFIPESTVDSKISTAVAGLLDSAPSTLDTLNELAAALADDPNFATTIANQLGAIETNIDTVEAELNNKKTEIVYEISSDQILASGGRYMVDTSLARTLTLPSTPSVGDEIWIIDQTGQASTNNITVNNGGSLINGVSDILVIDVNGASALLIYTGSTLGWRI